MMYGTIATAALLGFSAVVSARPAASWSTSASTATTLIPSASVSGMRYPAGNSSAPAATGTGVPSSGGVFTYPLSNGFPVVANPSSQLDQINQEAHGELSNKGAPTGLHPDTINSLAFVAFNELFEVAFFTELVQNITLNKPGFTAADIPIDRDTVLANLKVIVAQEELHELNANGAFKANTGSTVEPCTYKFPVDNFMDAIALASKFTDVVLGTLPDIQTVAATAGDFGLIAGVGASLGEEGEQNGFYRFLLNKVPAQLPFLTGGARNFAFNAILQNFVVECPASTLNFLEKPAAGIPLNATGVLNVLTSDLSFEDVTAEFSVQTVIVADTQSYYESNKGDMAYLTYINQQNAPLSVPITDISFSAGAIHFKASFPGKTDFLNGLTIAAVTSGNAFTSNEAVASATLFGPGLIEID